MHHFSYTSTPCHNIALTLQLCHNVVLCDNAMQLCCVKTLQQYELLRISRRVWLSLTACVFSCMWSHLCWSLSCSVGWSDCVYVFSVVLLCHSNAALNRIEAFWDSDLIVPNCIVSTLRCIDDWSIIVFFPIAPSLSSKNTIKQLHKKILLFGLKG